MLDTREKINFKPIVGYDRFDDIVFYSKNKEENKKTKLVIKNFPWYFYVKTKDITEDVQRELYRNLYFRNKYNPSGPALRKIYVTTEEDGSFTKIFCRRLESFAIRDMLNRFSIETYEADLTMTKRFMIDNLIEIEEDLSVLFFDIETDDSNPGIVIGRDRILSWAACDDTGKVYYSVNENEKELLKELLILFNKYDLIVGWNNRQFDFPYIQQRVKLLEFKDKKGNIIDEYHDAWKKIVNVDMMQRFIQLFGPRMTIVGLSGFSLNEVSKTFLNEQKIERKEKVIELYNDNREKLKRYNIKDAKLLYKLNKKLDVISLMIKECSWTGTFLNKNYIGELLDNYILRAANQKDIHLKTKPDWTENKKPIKIRGGYVMKPKTGLFENVRILDFKSLYPTIIVSWNIGQESLVKGEISKKADEDFKEWLNGRKLEDVPFLEWNKFLKLENRKFNSSNKYIQAGNNQFFVKNKKSVIAILVDNLMEERKQYKKIQIESKYDSTVYKNAFASQYAVKVLANSIYGISADQKSRFFDTRVAEAITTTGQLITRTTIYMLEEKMGYPILYADTDSTFLSVNSDIEIKKLTKRINEKLSNYLVKKYKIKEDVILIEYENKFRKFLMLDKKRYAGHLVEIDGKEADDILSKGTENVKKNTIEYSRFQIEELFIMLLKQDKEKEEVIEWLKERKKEILTEDIHPEDITITTRLSKPIASYKAKPPHVRLAEVLIQSNEMLDSHEGRKVWGQKIEYIVRANERKGALYEDKTEQNTTATVPVNVYLTKDFEKNNCQWDRNYYWDYQVMAPIIRILKAVWKDTQWEEEFSQSLEERKRRQQDREAMKINKEFKEEISLPSGNKYRRQKNKEEEILDKEFQITFNKYLKNENKR